MQAKFTQGSILVHILVMTLSGTVGLLALFIVDLMDLWYLSLLGEVEMPAAMGYAGAILFFTLSLNIGLSIGCSALVAQQAGRGDKASAQRMIAHIFVTIALTTLPITAVIFLARESLLAWVGAEGRALALASDYLGIVVLSTPILSLAMTCGGVMRALGQARRAMLLTIVGAVVNALLDPILIFVLNLEIAGAALATLLARVAMLAYGVWIVHGRNELLGTIEFHRWAADCVRYFRIAAPAVLTNLSTPIGLAYITYVMADFGNDAVAGNAIIGRLQPVAFAGLFALSGAIGPIAGQNLGAQQIHRITLTLRQSLLFVLVYCAIACGILFAATEILIAAFQASGQTAQIVRWFCYGFSLIFVFNGTTFVTNAMFNNLDAAHVATGFNFAKATVGTIPFVYFGAQWAGPLGIYWGATLGAAIIAILGVVALLRHIHRLRQR